MVTNVSGDIKDKKWPLIVKRKWGDKARNYGHLPQTLSQQQFKIIQKWFFMIQKLKKWVENLKSELYAKS